MLKVSVLQSHEKAAFRDGRQKVLPQGPNEEPTFEVHKRWEKNIEKTESKRAQGPLAEFNGHNGRKGAWELHTGEPEPCPWCFLSDKNGTVQLLHDLHLPQEKCHERTKCFGLIILLFF